MLRLHGYLLCKNDRNYRKKMVIFNKVTFYWKVKKFWISLTKFVWAIDKRYGKFQENLLSSNEIKSIFCPPLFRKRPILQCKTKLFCFRIIRVIILSVPILWSLLACCIQTEWTVHIQSNLFEAGTHMIDKKRLNLTGGCWLIRQMFA